jgi:hypothetical protein
MSKHQFSQRNNSTTMAPIDDALADLESLPSGQDFSYTDIAAKWGVQRSTLSRRHRHATGTRTEGYAKQQVLGLHKSLSL